MSDFDWTFAEGQALEDLFRPGTPRCSHCGASAPEGIPGSQARCSVCGAHLRTCGNCMFYNGIGCMILEPAFWAEGAVRGRFCAAFNWADDEWDRRKTIDAAVEPQTD